jgi:hypothetical protein
MRTPRSKLYTALQALAATAHDWTFGYMVRTGLVLPALPIKYDKIDDVPEDKRPLYVERDGAAFLDVEGLDGDPKALKSALDTERGGRTKAEREAREAREALKRFDGIDPEQARKILSQTSDSEEQQLIAAGKIEVLRDRWLGNAKKEHERELGAMRAELDEERKLTAAFRTEVMQSHIASAVMSRDDIHHPALKDIRREAAEEGWTLNKAGKFVQLDAEGGEILGADSKPVKFSAWLDDKRATNPHWFKLQNSGSGASGDRGARPKANAEAIHSMPLGPGKLQAAREASKAKQRRA